MSNRKYLSSTGKDLLIIGFILVVIFALSYFFDVFVLIVKFLQQNPSKIIYADEIITTLLTLSIGLALFSWRRWSELKKETSERMKKQAEIIRLTETHAEVERIISKQLHSDIDQMRQDVRQILQILLNKHRRVSDWFKSIAA